MKRKIAAAAAAVIAAVAFAAPAQAAQPADLDDVRYMVALGKSVWYDSETDAICDMFYLRPKFTRDYMAEMFYYDVFDGEFSMYDSKRAAWRILNWGC